MIGASARAGGGVFGRRGIGVQGPSLQVQVYGVYSLRTPLRGHQESEAMVGEWAGHNNSIDSSGSSSDGSNAEAMDYDYSTVQFRRKPFPFWHTYIGTHDRSHLRRVHAQNR